ncbi:MAG: secF [Moraxellaceae bacterium]|jgi:preprotein translocase subunit SecF|nr:secF [Moraxellaceae bacterium]MDF3030051.1 secF [Moraxellaceae bacterium]
MAEQRIVRFMKHRKLIAAFSLAVVLIGIVSLVVRGLNLGQDFTGGTTAEISFAKPVDQEAVKAALEKAGFHDALVQHLDTISEVQVRMPPQKGHESNLSADIQKAVSFDPDNPATLRQVDSVGSQVGDELYTQSLYAVILSLGLMMVYVAMRFRFKFAVGGVVSLLHDVLFTVGIFSIFGWPFDLTVLAAVLALIGYSLNDTIVIFDRIRENFRKLRRADPEEIVDLSLTETLRRTFMTVTTVILVVLALLFLGGPALKWFSIALLIGLFVGTYSSIYIATNYALTMGLSKEDFLVAKGEVDDRP